MNPETPMNNSVPTAMLRDAAKTINNRANDRDTAAERSMEGTVKAFNAIYGTNLTESQGWAFMTLLKLKRQTVGPAREDDFIDGAAYFALLGEARLEETRRENEPKLRGGARLPPVPPAPAYPTTGVMPAMPKMMDGVKD